MSDANETEFERRCRQIAAAESAIQGRAPVAPLIPAPEQEMGELEALQMKYDMMKTAYEAELVHLRAQVPMGFVVVPVVPTAEMSTAGKHALKGSVDAPTERVQAECVYGAMVAAASTTAATRQIPVATVVNSNPENTMSWLIEPALPVGTELYTTPPAVTAKPDLAAPDCPICPDGKLVAQQTHWCDKCGTTIATTEDCKANVQHMRALAAPVVEQASAANDAAELAEWRRLKDPNVLYASLLQGLPARLTPDQFRHIAGDFAKEKENGKRGT